MKVYVDMNRKYDQIVGSWDECVRLQKEIGGLNFKSFTTLGEAEQFLRGTVEPIAKPVTVAAQGEPTAASVEVRLLQGLARYAKDPKANQEEYELKKIEKYKLDRIFDFTLSIPEKENMIAVCRKVATNENLTKIAEIYEENGTTLLKFLVNTSELEVSGEPIGYLEIKMFGYQFYYEVSVKAVPDYAEYDGVIAFVDGSSGGTSKIAYEGEEYCQYGGAYLFYKNGEKVPFVTSKDEKNPIVDGLKGISKSVGNVYGELNSAIKAMQRAEELGIEKLKIYYDCEQIGGNAPGGVNQQAGSKITKKYLEFWESQKFQNLKQVEFIHVDAHTKFDLNDAVDKMAKSMRDIVALEFEEDEVLRDEYLAHRFDYS